MFVSHKRILILFLWNSVDFGVIEKKKPISYNSFAIPSRRRWNSKGSILLDSIFTSTQKNPPNVSTSNTVAMAMHGCIIQRADEETSASPVSLSIARTEVSVAIKCGYYFCGRSGLCGTRKLCHSFGGGKFKHCPGGKFIPAAISSGLDG